MTIKSTKFKSGEEILLSIFLLDDENIEKKRFSFYVEPSKMEIEPELRKSITDLPGFLKLIYKAGMDGVELNFEENSINV